MQHTTKEEKVRGDMGMGESLSLPGLATELEGLRPHVNIPLVKVFARLEPAYTPRFPRGSVERSLRAGCMSAAPLHHFHPNRLHWPVTQLRRDAALLLFTPGPRYVSLIDSVTWPGEDECWVVGPSNTL